MSPLQDVANTRKTVDELIKGGIRTSSHSKINNQDEGRFASLFKREGKRINPEKKITTVAHHIRADAVQEPSVFQSNKLDPKFL